MRVGLDRFMECIAKWQCSLEVRAAMFNPEYALVLFQDGKVLVMKRGMMKGED